MPVSCLADAYWQVLAPARTCHAAVLLATVCKQTIGTLQGKADMLLNNQSTLDVCTCNAVSGRMCVLQY